jgi:hypothetical protein
MAEESAGEGMRSATPHVSVYCHAPLASFVRESSGAWRSSSAYVREDGTTKQLPERDSIVQVVDEEDEPVTLATFTLEKSSRPRVRISCPRCRTVAEASNMEQLFPILDTLAAAGVRKVSLREIAARLSMST